MNTPFDITTPRSPDGFWHCKTRDGRDAVFTNVPPYNFFDLSGVIDRKTKTAWSISGRSYIEYPPYDHPNDLDLSTVETLPKDEYAELKAAHAAGKVIEARLPSGDWYHAHPSWTMPVEDYRIKPEPVMVPMEQKDISPCCAFRTDDNKLSWGTITGTFSRQGIEGVIFPDGEEVTFTELQDEYEINRSLASGKWDETAWEKCEKEAK
jgi:hypothetical protein